VIHLREGSAGRRIGAMRVLRRFPSLEPALRDGKLCPSTASLLAPVLTNENLEELVARAAYRTKAEVEELVVTLRPRPEPHEGIRKLTAPAPVATTAANGSAGSVLLLGPAISLQDDLQAAPVPSAPAATPFVLSPPTPTKVEPVAEDRWSVRLTLDKDGKADLETLRALLSHKIPNGELGAVIREAIRCAIEKHGIRRGASAPPQARRRGGVRPASEPDSSQPPSPYVPADVRREVWKRDGGRCTYVGPDGCRCDSRWQLEFDHIVPPALGGTSTAESVRLRCRAHNMLHAEHVYGREHMDLFRRPASIAGDSRVTRGGEP
jgi:hypothetical protein